MNDPTAGLKAAKVATAAEPRVRAYEALAYNPYALCPLCKKSNMSHDVPNHCTEDVDDC